MEAGKPTWEAEELSLLQAVFEQHCEFLRFEAGIGFNIISGFVTIHLAVAAWLVSNAASSTYGQAGMVIFDLMLGLAAAVMVGRNYSRRSDLMHTIEGFYDATGLKAWGRFVPARAIIAEAGTKSFLWVYMGIIVCFTLAQLFIILLAWGAVPKSPGT